MTKIVVAARDLFRGTILSDADLKLEERDISKLHHGYLDQTTQALGKKLERNLRRNEVLSPRQVESPLVVKRGSGVTIIAQRGSMEIRARGKAMGNGAAGERIRVRNESSKKELDATVISPGMVEVAL